MAVSVDTVYQKVLALANKEQRGYITPQEFNLFADHAQKDIFRQYFHDLDQARRRTGNDTRYADIATGIEEKIAMFEMYDRSAGLNNEWGDINLNIDFPDLYKVTMVRVRYHDKKSLNTLGSPGSSTILDKMELSEMNKYGHSYLVRNARMMRSCGYYILTKTSADNYRMKIYPYPNQTEDKVHVSYIRLPKTPKWTYIISGENALFNPSLSAGFQDFELHSSEEGILVIKILQLAGINIKDGSLVQIAAQEELKKIQQEKA